jgi:hypothetical protein
MIENDDQMRRTAEQMLRMYYALSDLRQRVLPVNRRNYELFAEGPIEEIRRLRGEIDEYLGLNQPADVAEPAERASA